MSDIIPIWSSHYSLFDSVLTLEEPGKTRAGNPISIFDVAKRDGLKEVILVDTSIGGFLEGYKSAAKAGVHFIFGLKLCVCSDMLDKSEPSLKTESNIIIFARNSQAYSDLIKIQSRASTDGFYRKARADWNLLKTYWTENLSLALPTYSSFIYRNLMSLSSIVPSFPVTPTLFKETDSRLPFESLVNEAIDQYAQSSGAPVQPVKSVYYEDSARDFDAYVTFRAIGNRGEFARPQVDHLCSDRFSYSAYRELVGAESAPRPQDTKTT